MTSAGRVLLLVVAGVFLGLGLLWGLRGLDYSAHPDRVECGSVLAPTTFVVSDARDSLVGEAARCAGEVAQTAPRTWAALGGAAVLVVVAVASLVDSAPVSRPRTGESGAQPRRS